VYMVCPAGTSASLKRTHSPRAFQPPVHGVDLSEPALRQVLDVHYLEPGLGPGEVVGDGSSCSVRRDGWLPRCQV
jgi:hypothetical protein